MRLSPEDWEALRRHLAKAKRTVLDAGEEHQLRFILSKANPRAARMNLVELMHLGFFVYGVHELQQMADPAADVTA